MSDTYSKEPIAEAVKTTAMPAEMPVREIETYSRTTKPKIEGLPNKTVNNVVAEPTKPEPKVTLSPQLSALARKEAAVRQQERLIAQQKKEFEGKLADAEKYAQMKQKLTAKDFSAAEELGLTYEEYSAFKLKQLAGENPQEKALQEVKDELAAMKKADEEKESKQFDANVAEYRKVISSTIDTDAEFARLKKLSPEKRKLAETGALQLILDSFEDDGVEMTVDEAIKDVHAYLLAEAKELSSILDEEVKPAAKVLPPPRVGIKTLTQQVTPSSEKAPLKPLYLMSENERWAEARRRVEARKLQG
jgi:hypothetical protein